MTLIVSATAAPAWCTAVVYPRAYGHSIRTRGDSGITARKQARDSEERTGCQTVVTTVGYRRTMSTRTTILWRLRGDTLRNIVCLTFTTASGVTALQIELEGETLLHEVYPDDRSATRRAAYIRDTLLRDGWLLDAA